MPSMKLPRVTVQHDLKWNEHVDSMISKISARKYFVVVLQWAGVQTKDLIKFYCSVMRPVLEYAAPVWHPGLTCQQSDMLGCVQRHVLRLMFPDSSYRDALHATGLQTLHHRRETLCLNFALSLLHSEFKDWLPRGLHGSAKKYLIPILIFKGNCCLTIHTVKTTDSLVHAISMLALRDS